MRRAIDPVSSAAGGAGEADVVLAQFEEGLLDQFGFLLAEIARGLLFQQGQHVNVMPRQFQRLESLPGGEGRELAEALSPIEAWGMKYMDAPVA